VEDEDLAMDRKGTNGHGRERRGAYLLETARTGKRGGRGAIRAILLPNVKIPSSVAAGKHK